EGGADAPTEDPATALLQTLTGSVARTENTNAKIEVTLIDAEERVVETPRANRTEPEKNVVPSPLSGDERNARGEGRGDNPGERRGAQSAVPVERAAAQKPATDAENPKVASEQPRPAEAARPKAEDALGSQPKGPANLVAPPAQFAGRIDVIGFNSALAPAAPTIVSPTVAGL